ncbi:metallophosphoesterase family protein [Hymenobacter oligotrophus]|nr:metallophosphoesterase [Hymenobacter oligotrophus]
MPIPYASLKHFLLGWLLACTLLAAPTQAQRFAAIGDYGYAGTPERDVASLVKSWNPHFVITLGDNNYDYGDSTTIDQNIGQYYHEYIGFYQGRYGQGSAYNRFFPSLGNHDLYTANGIPFLRYFTLPGNGRYYEYRRGNVHFFVLNSDPAEPHGVASNSVQAQWLKRRLALARAPWKVVYFHHAPYSSGQHGNATVMQWPFKDWGASVVLSGHDHHYERLLVDGFPYFVNGLGGRNIYNLNPQRTAAGSRVRYNADYGAMLMQASADTLRLEFYTRRGQRIDSYTLGKGLPLEGTLYPPAPNPFSGSTELAFAVPEPGRVQIRVLNLLGQEVATLFDADVRAGKRQLRWYQGALKAGIYQVVMTSPSGKVTARAEVL